ncbi:MAG: DUF4157 domain-containing protein [Deltaproteobacteria bacterium]|nr:DUF4157 domain-containing protein [Deltaproteobacteria bacterium]
MRDRHDGVEGGLQGERGGHGRSAEREEVAPIPIRPAGRRTLVEGTSTRAIDDRTGAAGSGPIRLPEGMGGGDARSPYTESSGGYLGFGAESGSGDVAVSGARHGTVPQESDGSPLPAATRVRFEASLGGSLAGVRVHDGAASAQAAASIGARAFTAGQDIHFGAGEYQPGTSSGDHLLAHEVAHTRQQAGASASPGIHTKLAVSSPGDNAEAEADIAADDMVIGRPAEVTPQPGGQLLRKTGAWGQPLPDQEPARAAGPPRILATPSRIEFPLTSVGLTSRAKVHLTALAPEPTVVISAPVTAGFQVTRYPVGSDLRADSQPTVDLTFRPAHTGVTHGQLSIHERSHDTALQIPLLGDGLAHPTKYVAPQRLPVARASEVLLEMELRDPTGYLDVLQQRQQALGGDTALFPSGRGAEAFKAIWSEAARIHTLHRLIRLKESNSAPDAVPSGPVLRPDAGQTNRAADRVREAGSPEVTEAGGEIADAELRLRAMASDLKVSFQKLQGALAAHQAALSDVDTVMLGFAHAKAQSKLKRAQDNLKRNGGRLAGALAMAGKVLKGIQKMLTEKPLEGIGEFLEAGATVVNAASNEDLFEIARLKEEVKRLDRGVQDARLDEVLHRASETAQGVAAARQDCQGKLAQVQDLDKLVRIRYLSLGQRAAEISGNPSMEGRIAPFGELVEITERMRAVSGSLVSLHVVDDARVVGSLLSPSGGDLAFATWAEVNLPRYADTLQTLMIHYEARRDESKGALSRMLPTVFQ